MGQFHAGVFDLAFLSCLPNMMIMCPSDEAELAHMVATAVAYDMGPVPCAIRGVSTGTILPEQGALEVGRGRILSEGIRSLSCLWAPY